VSDAERLGDPESGERTDPGTVAAPDVEDRSRVDQVDEERGDDPGRSRARGPEPVEELGVRRHDVRRSSVADP